MKYIAEFKVGFFKYWLQVTRQNTLALTGIIDNAAKFPAYDHAENYARIVQSWQKGKIFFKIIKSI